MDKNIVIIDVYDTCDIKDIKDNKFMRFEFNANSKKLKNFIDLCLEQRKYLILSVRDEKRNDY